jgi:hypothetical protein
VVIRAKCTVIYALWFDKTFFMGCIARNVPCTGKGRFAMTDDEIREAILTKLAVPLWPTAGKALGLGQHAAHAAAERVDIPTLQWSGKTRPVPTAWLRQVLGLDERAA